MRPTIPLALGTAVLACIAGAPAGATAARPVYRELKAETPTWYTPDLHRRVLAAGPQGVPLPAGAREDIPASGLGFVGIRPGSWMIAPAGCTMNFIFQGGTTSTTGGKKPRSGPKDRSVVSAKAGSTAFDPAQQLYIGTAGHCTEVGDQVTLVAVTPTAPNPVLVNIGRTVKSVDSGVGNDFALVEINPALNSWVSPAMAHFGGPTGTWSGTELLPVVHSGHGLVVGTGGTPRAGQVLYAHETDALYWAGATVFGDSGSALNTATGLAAADITHLIVDLKYPGANSAGTRIAKMLQIAGKDLATCSVAVPWPAPGCPPV
ncbi:MAG TPA: hypothetical protein VNA20_12275 [Frankiaceae bacterium]|nr:hypothetical protein [Frankiaceae bacterium]